MIAVKVVVNICQRRALTITGQTRDLSGGPVVKTLSFQSRVYETTLILICGMAETESDSYGLNGWGKRGSECVDFSLK